MALLHPFAQLTPEEILQTQKFINSSFAKDGGKLVFKSITLKEPAKEQVIVYLDAEHAGKKDKPSIDRLAFVNYYLADGIRLHEAVINLTKDQLVYHKELGALEHGHGDFEEVMWIEAMVLADPRVLDELAKLGITDTSLLVCEPWVYGSDGMNDSKRQFQCFLFLRDPANVTELESNHFAMPIPLAPVVDVAERRVTRLDFLPTGKDNTLRTSLEGYKMPPPNEYLPKYQKLRTDLKPLNVVQPDGASFTIIEEALTSHVVKWQKWHFRLGFNAREGMVLYDVRYDDRPLFYRVALSDMNIPYADPRHPFHKKAAFDLGDAGAGATANDLKLGCDCLGSIYYLDGYINTPGGDVWQKKNCVCIHEQDSGIGWKHTNYRTDTAAVTRSRELVLQSILTVANYEYILAFQFNQAGELAYEVRATGILSTQPVDEGIDVPWGTVVHPGVLAAHHQHIFSLRLDPMIDGHKNRLIFEEAIVMPRSAELNPHGVGYTVEETVVDTSAGLDLDIAKNRVFKIKNPESLNPVNKKPVGYKIMAPDFQKMLADDASFHHKRAQFADHNIYVTKYRDNELYAAGQYTNQSRGSTGVRSWAHRRESVLDQDIVVWVQFGINHVPRIEDFPVMPCEILKVHFKPVNFFDKNPALDVPPSTQAANKSCLLSAQAVKIKL